MTELKLDFLCFESKFSLCLNHRMTSSIFDCFLSMIVTTNAPIHLQNAPVEDGITTTENKCPQCLSGRLLRGRAMLPPLPEVELSAHLHSGVKKGPRVFSCNQVTWRAGQVALLKT